MALYRDEKIEKGRKREELRGEREWRAKREFGACHVLARG